MPGDSGRELAQQLSQLDAGSHLFATRFVDSLLAAGQEVGASDLHIEPLAEGLRVRWRIDGVMQTVGLFESAAAVNVLTRLKVLADLLTYRSDVPQEGRIRQLTRAIEMRVSTFPTLFGEKGVVRFFATGESHSHLSELSLPPAILDKLNNLLSETSGMILLTGPAGSGKTTTLYACLREISNQSSGGRNVVSLEDPVELVVPGVVQSQVNAVAGFNFATGLRSLMRQDPDVIMVGEIRDRETAEVAFQASLTGQVVLSSFHASSAAAAISRLSDMGIEPYLLRSGLRAVVAQRLVRRLCQCAVSTNDPVAMLALPISRARMAVGCDECRGVGYRGRFLIAEMLLPEQGELPRAILTRADTFALEQAAVQSGMITRWTRAREAVEAGITSPQEIRRVFGLSNPPSASGKQNP